MSRAQAPDTYTFELSRSEVFALEEAIRRHPNPTLDSLRDDLEDTCDHISSRSRQTSYTVQEAAARLFLSERTVRYWCQTGRLSAKRVGRAWVIPSSSIKVSGN